MDSFTVFSLILLLSLLMELIIGIIMLSSKPFGDKKKKAFGTVLLAMVLFNFIFFAFMSSLSRYTPKEIVALALFFLVTFIEGLTFLVSKEVKKKVQTIFGILLLFVVALWIIVAVLSAI